MTAGRRSAAQPQWASATLRPERFARATAAVVLASGHTRRFAVARSATLLASFRPAPIPTSLLPLPTAAGPRQQTTAPRHQPLGTGVPRTELQRLVDSLAARCGLTSAVMRAESAALHDDWVGGQPPIGGADLVATLRLGARDRARATFDLDRIATALEWAVELHELTGRVLFRPLQHAGDIAASIYNADSLEQLAEFIRRKGSRQRGRIGHKLASDKIGRAHV